MSERETFEEWYFDTYMLQPERHPLDPDKYAYPHAKDTWIGWQARAAVQAAQPEAVGEPIYIEACLSDGEGRLLDWRRIAADQVSSYKRAGWGIRYLFALEPTETAQPEEPVFHLRSFGDVSAKQLDEYCKRAKPEPNDAERLAVLREIVSKMESMVPQGSESDLLRRAQAAARWDEFRTGKPITVKCKKATVMFGPNPEPDYPESLDAAIDAAIRATKGGKL